MTGQLLRLRLLSSSISAVGFSQMKIPTSLNSSRGISIFSRLFLSQARYDQCSISPLSLKGIKAAGYERMTLLQEATVPVILKGEDMLAKAKTSTGKTLAFLQSKFGMKTQVVTSHYDTFPMPLSLRSPGTELSGKVGSIFSIRCLSTVVDAEESSVQDASVASQSIAPRIKFKRLDKTARHIMQTLDKEAVEEVKATREVPDIRPGYHIKMKVEVPENKRKVSNIEGIVIARRNAGLNTTFRVRRLVAGVGVESVFPLYSPNIKEVKIIDKQKVRRAKLYYLRDRLNPLRSKK